MNSNKDLITLATEIFHKDKYLKEAVSSLTDEQRSKLILSERYPKTHNLYELSESNKEFTTNLQTLAYTILNMEFEGGRDLDKLAEMYLETVKQLSILGHSGSIIEMKNLKKIMDKASKNNYDEIEAAKIFIKQGLLHNRENFEYVLSGLFED